MPENVSTSRIYAQSGLGVTLAGSASLFITRYTVTTFYLESLSYKNVFFICRSLDPGIAIFGVLEHGIWSELEVFSATRVFLCTQF